jgi:hypothetical protein
MERIITDDQKEIIINLGALNYSAIDCAAVLEWPEEETIALFTNTKSEFHKLYQRGKVRSDYVIDLKLFEQAQQGDIKSLEKLQLRINNRNRGR